MKRLAELRKERNLSQAELANILHVSQQAICKYELGQAEPDIYTLKGIADVFHTTVDYLVEYDSGIGRSNNSELIINNKPVTRAEINHLIAYRKLNEGSKKHIDAIIDDLNN